MFKTKKATQQFHENPKKLPPRYDIRKLRVIEDDPDLEGDEDTLDEDLIESNLVESAKKKKKMLNGGIKLAKNLSI